MDNLKISCQDKVELTKLIYYLRRIYKEKMMVHHGGKGKYLGMCLDFMEGGMFQVDMSDYIQGILDEFQEPIVKGYSTLHSDNLFTVKDEEMVEHLPEDQVMQYHQTPHNCYIC